MAVDLINSLRIADTVPVGSQTDDISIFLMELDIDSFVMSSSNYRPLPPCSKAGEEWPRN
jgi:hypothetical protein